MRSSFLRVIIFGAMIGFGLAGRHGIAPASGARTVAAGDQPVETVLQRRDSGHFSTTADVNGEAVNFIVDTGADTVSLTEDDARRAHIAFDPSSFIEVAHGAGGGALSGQRVHIDSIILDGKRVSDLSGVVLDGAQVSLLGQNYLRHVSVAIDGDTMKID